MKILYAIQGTGNGHMARAYEVIPELKKHGDVDIVVSGIQTEISLPWPVKFRYYGMGFIFGKNGGVDIKSTIRKTHLHTFIKEIFSVPIHHYDLVINDFEPVVAWACKLKGKKCISLSHQSAVLHPKAPKPRIKDYLGRNILKFYAPTSYTYGFHFNNIDSNITTPVIRSDIRNATTTNTGHYTVYLPSYSDDKIIKVLTQIPNIEWQVFSKHNNEEKTIKNIHIQPVDKEKFTKSFLSCEGILCNAGFETPAEALYMGKKLCVIPMKGQYEQQCNAAFVENMGITTLTNFEASIERINDWVVHKTPIKVSYPNNLAELIDEIIFRFTPQFDSIPQMAISSQFKI
nr:glycosyltransferase family protein [uncultured Carboxylicivirga sp.]